MEKEIQESNTNIELFTSSIDFVELMDNVNPSLPKVAKIRIKLISKGMNSKALNWLPETMEKIAPRFRGVPFRYDLNGQNEGSHTREHISSPFYDVGWTYSDERGAYYDPVSEAIWVQGEVTHPDVIQKLMRKTTDGKREINFASMGVMMKPEHTRCSICKKSPFGTCNHQRGKDYDGVICALEPTDISKALHVALTNDPADKNAEIAEAIFQDMATSVNSVDSGVKQSPVPVSQAGDIAGTPSVPELKLKNIIRGIILEMIRKKQIDPSALSELSDDMEENKMADDKDIKKVEEKEEEIIDDKDKKKKKKKDEEDKVEDVKGDEKVVEKKEVADNSEEPKEEVKEDDQPKEEPKEEVKEEEPKEESKEEVKDEEKKDEPMVDEQPKEESKEEEKEEEQIPPPEGPINEVADNTEFKIKGVAGVKKDRVEVADNSRQGTQKQTVDYAQKYKNKLVQELADTYVNIGKVRNKEEAVSILSKKTIEQLEIYQDAFDGISIEKPVSTKSIKVETADNNNLQPSVNSNEFADNVPEYGGVVEQYDPIVELQDMTAEERDKIFGDYGKYDVCFNPYNAPKYLKKE